VKRALNPGQNRGVKGSTKGGNTAREERSGSKEERETHRVRVANPKLKRLGGSVCHLPGTGELVFPRCHPRAMVYTGEDITAKYYGPILRLASFTLAAGW